MGTPILYGDNKFAVDVKVDEDIRSTEARTFSVYIGLLDFRTQQYYRLRHRDHINNLKLLNEDHLIIATLNGIRILDMDTLIEEKVDTLSKTNLLIKDSQVISGGNKITIWNYDNNSRIDISMPRLSGFTKSIQFLDDDKLIFMTTKEIGLIDLKTRLMIKRVDTLILHTQPIDKFHFEKWNNSLTIIPFHKEIMISSRTKIFIFDYNLNLKRHTFIEDQIFRPHLLPDGKLMVPTRNSIRIHNFETLELLIPQIKHSSNIS